MRDPIKALIWLYFLLLVGEGVLRKWVLPGLAEPLLLVRDPVVVLIYLLAISRGVFPWRLAVLGLAVMAMLSVVFATIGEGHLLVTIYGLRINYLHPPLLFLMPMVLNRRDVIQFGKAVLWLSVPIAWLMLLQYNSPSLGLLNVGSGGSVGGQLDGALGKLRPSGPFSFITGPVSWFALTTAFLFYGWTHRAGFSRASLWLAAAATALAIPISISRSLLMSVVVVVLFGVVSLARDVSKAWRILLPVLFLAGFFSLIEEQGLTAAFESRWENSTVRHGGIQVSIVDRFFSEYTGAWHEISHAPLLGSGVGLGSNVGSRLATGEVRFVLAESEWPRIVLELGPILGAFFIFFRCWVAGHVIVSSLRKLFTEGDSLAWLLAGASFLSLLSGQWGQPTILGFAIFGGGLALSAVNEEEEPEDFTAEVESDEQADAGDTATDAHS